MNFLIKFYPNNNQNKENIIINSDKILSIDIYHEENAYSTCKITIIIDSFPKKQAPSTNILILTHDNTTIFNGRIQEIIQINKNLYELILIAKPINPKESILKLYQNYIKNLDKLDQNILDLFLPKHDQESTEKILQQITSSTIFCDPITHDIKLSNIIDGSRTKISNILNNFSIKHKARSISAVHLNINFNWIWNGFFIKDIYKEIAKYFDGETLSTENLIDKFNKIKLKFNHKNIDIISSKLFKIKNQTITKRICNKSFNINKSTVFGELKIKVHKNIKIYDNFSINIINSKSNNNANVKKLNLNLNSLAALKYPNWQPYKQYFENDTVFFDHQIFKAKNDHVSDENFNKKQWINQENQPFMFSFDEPFFDSEYGKRTIQQAIKIAKSYITFHNRNTNILFKIPLNNGIFLSTDQVAEIYTQNQLIEGKIVKIHNKISCDDEFSEILIKTNSNFKLSSNNSNTNEDINVKTKTENTDDLFFATGKALHSVNITNNFTKQSEILDHTFKDLNDFKIKMDNANTDISLTLTQISQKNSLKNISNAKDIIY